MSSAITLGPKQSRGYFVPLGDCTSSILQFNGGSGSGGSFVNGSFTTASWASITSANATNATCSAWVKNSIGAIGQGGLLKDMGKTVVSASRTFRKVQLVTSATSTSGVAGSATDGNPFFTGYIELNTGLGGANDSLAGFSNGYLSSTGYKVAPVAYMPGLLM